MIAAVFKEPLQCVCAPGDYLEGNRKTVARTERFSPRSFGAIDTTVKLIKANIAQYFGIGLESRKTGSKAVASVPALLRCCFGAERHAEVVLEAVD